MGTPGQWAVRCLLPYACAESLRCRVCSGTSPDKDNPDVRYVLRILQGLLADISDTRNLMTQIGNLAALRSLILGELPTATLEQGRQLLADAGFLANVMNDCAQAADAEGAVTSDVRARRLFTAQQQRLSNAEMDTLDEHRRTREFTDEDFVY